MFTSTCEAYSSNLRSRLSGSRILPRRTRLPLFILPRRSSFLAKAQGSELARFQDVGFEHSFVNAMTAAFPAIKHPSLCQEHFIRAVLGPPKCILLKDRPGTGKSFALIMALLNKPRAHKVDLAKRGRGDTAITSLVIVPHRDLAQQMHHWIERVVSETFKSPKSALPFLARVLVRGSGVNLPDQLESLRSTPPHILIGTPQALLEGIQCDPESLQLPWVQTVAVDEADYLIPIATNQNLGQRQRKQKKFDRHRAPAIDVLDAIYGADSQIRLRSDRPPQLILASATLDKDIRGHLVTGRGWIKDTKDIVRINGETLRTGSDLKGTLETPSDSSGNVVHHALYVTDEGLLKNIEEAKPMSKSLAFPLPHVVECDSSSIESQRSSPTVNRRRAAEFEHSPSPFRPIVIETIAEIFALDVPMLALLVLPSSGSVERVVYELQSYGVNAHGLDLLDNDRGRAQLLSSGLRQTEPTLLVSNGASTRGVDLPNLSHVFIMGLPDSKDQKDDYLHFAGRTGRFGGPGTVITFLNSMKDQSKARPSDQRRLCRIYNDVKVVPNMVVEADSEDAFQIIQCLQDTEGRSN